MKKSPRHYFRFKLADVDGITNVITGPAMVYRGKKRVVLTLTADDVRRSIQLDGAGNTMTCSMSICAKRYAKAFPHNVEGYVDWQYSVAYVVSKIGKNGLPSACVAYNHSDEIARLNDTPGGQHRLLAQLEKEGPRTVTLLPSPQSTRKTHKKGVGRERRSRSSRPAAVGAGLRFAVAHLGGVAAPK